MSGSSHQTSGRSEFLCGVPFLSPRESSASQLKNLCDKNSTLDLFRACQVSFAEHALFIGQDNICGTCSSRLKCKYFITCYEICNFRLLESTTYLISNPAQSAIIHNRSNGLGFYGAGSSFRTSIATKTRPNSNVKFSHPSAIASTFATRCFLTLSQISFHNVSGISCKAQSPYLFSSGALIGPSHLHLPHD